MSILSNLLKASDLFDPVLDCFAIIVEWVILLSGPLLITLASGLISFVCYIGFGSLLPQKAEFLSWQWWMYVGTGLFLLANIAFNYLMCAITNPGTHDSPEYQKLLAEAQKDGKLTDIRMDSDCEFSISSSSEENEYVQEDSEISLTNRSKQQKLSKQYNSRNWLEQGPDEWGWCYKSNVPKAPRAHYCHVILFITHFIICITHPLTFTMVNILHT
eukprot:GSMAST32.ASY1.ANO1.1844.1 assembled CDS